MKNGLDAAYEYCRQVTRREARNFYYGFLLLPSARRRAVYSVYAFARECDDIADAGLPPEEAAQRLGAQREALSRCLAGEPDGPVFQALGRTVDRYQVPREYLHTLVDGIEMDTVRDRYNTFDELREYCYRVASVVGLVCIEIFGYRGAEKARAHAADLGIALQLTNILRDLREDAERGRVYLPLDEVEWFGYSEEELFARRNTGEFRRFMIFQADRARDYFRRGRRLLPLLPPRARACVSVMTGIYSSILDTIERDPGVVFRRRVSLGTPQKLALAGRELVRSIAG